MAKKKWNRASVKTAVLGDFDYGFLCMPRWPFCSKKLSPAPPFFGPNAWLGIFPALIMGLQHSLAMAGGLVTPPLLIGLMAPRDDTATKSYLIQASLLVCGITTLIQVLGMRIPKTPYQLGSGVLSVMGVSFAGLPLFQSVVGILMAQGDTFEVALGKMLGTSAVCAVWPMILSFMPARALKKVFPPIVTGTTIFLIGAKLIATGFKYWGGGVFCGENYLHLPKPSPNCVITMLDGSTMTGPCYNAMTAPLCADNGDVKLPFGSGPYIGMGFLTFSMIVIIEIFGSPFMRNASLVLALFIGTAISAAVKVGGKSFITGDILASSPAFTFLWVKRFPLGFYPPAVLPLIIVFSITSVETVGDVTATEELSRLDADGEHHNRRIKGGMLNDGFSGIFSSVAGSLPLTTFAQNNGVIALTNVASRHAGYAGAGWLFLFGLIGKFGGLVLSIPQCVLGGATSFLFACVLVAGIKILMLGEGFSRRNRFIVSCALAFGMGVSMVPQWSKNALWPDPGPGASSSLMSVRTATLLILDTGFCVGAIVAFALNMVVPYEENKPEEIVEEPSVHHAAEDDSARGYSSTYGGNDDAKHLAAVGKPVAEAVDAPRDVTMSKDTDAEGMV
ncbi:hypothetical protein OEZ85_004671 [Tetradesmus obliquus]|uniref:Uric acid-xanthine permease n=1 Tax=Tetradesmus obliquus TaxID=3088 RepID=A0ABY8UM85_TETOB|nr:hypothetical protein OEZ85_004671 [Tetradesmus obliquus]